MHKNRTYNGLLKEKAHDERYKKMLIGKQTMDGKIIINSEWIGNAVYGIVQVFFNDGTNKLVGNPYSFKPKKEDFNLAQNIAK